MSGFNIAKKVAFITGAGQGLGRATAARLAALGTKVICVDLSQDHASAVAKEIGSNAIAFSGDVSDEDQMKAAVALAMEKFGSIDIAVNCAGIAPPSKIIGKKGPHNLKQFAKVLEVNTVGTFNVCRLTAEAMSKNEADEVGIRGVIINTASVAAFEGQIGQCAYAASKGGVAAMTLPMARDLSSLGVRVCTIAPGLFLTPMLEGLPQKVRDDLGATVPLPKRLGKPIWYAQMVQSIIENPMLNGEVIRLDGALRMQP